jgi:hypothetical protein
VRWTAVASEMRPYQSDRGQKALLIDAILPAYRSLGDVLFATQRETILLAIVVKFCQMISGADFRTDKYLRSLAKREPSLHED